MVVENVLFDQIIIDLTKKLYMAAQRRLFGSVALPRINILI